MNIYNESLNEINERSEFIIYRPFCGLYRLVAYYILHNYIMILFK